MLECQLDCVVLWVGCLHPNGDARGHQGQHIQMDGDTGQGPKVPAPRVPEKVAGEPWLLQARLMGSLVLSRASAG